MKTDYHFETKGLTKDFGGLRALNSLSVSICRQEIVGLIGPNGSGKTTFTNVVAGFYKPTSGQVIYNGQHIQGLPPWEIAKLGILRTFQSTQSFSMQTVLENMIFGCHLKETSGIFESTFRRARVNSERKKSEAKAMGILESLGLAQYALRPVISLPPAAQRTLAIGRALAADPEFLFLDEPAAGLSAEESDRLISLVRGLRDKGMTILAIDHHMRLMMTLCDRIVVIDYGTKIAEGKPQEIAANERVIEAYLGRRKII
jgi:branched-chain amino acid transport system ATP-binding protein